MQITDQQRDIATRYGHLFVNTGGNEPVAFLERNDINMFSNAPAALLQSSVLSQVLLIERLVESKLLGATACRGVQHPNCEYLATCGSVCNKCGQSV